MLSLWDYVSRIMFWALKPAGLALVSITELYLLNHSDTFQAAGNEEPLVLLTSQPCQGFSGG